MQRTRPCAPLRDFVCVPVCIFFTGVGVCVFGGGGDGGGVA